MHIFLLYSKISSSEFPNFSSSSSFFFTTLDWVVSLRFVSQYEDFKHQLRVMLGPRAIVFLSHHENSPLDGFLHISKHHKWFQLSNKFVLSNFTICVCLQAIYL